MDAASPEAIGVIMKLALENRVDQSYYDFLSRYAWQYDVMLLK